MIRDKSGNLYGTTYSGGAYGFGSVFELSPSGSGWSDKTLYDFKGSGDYDGYEPTSLVMDAAGNLYGATAYGENFGPSVFQLVPTDQGWTRNIIWRLRHITLHGTRAHPAIDAAGNLFFATTASCGSMRRGDGSCNQAQRWNDAEVFKLTPSGGQWKCTILHDFTADEILNLSLDAHDNLYGTVNYAVYDDYGFIWQITP